MPAVIPFIPLIAAGIGGGAAVVAAHKGAKAQGSATDKALAYQREQDSTARAEADLDRKNQIAFAKFQWQSQAPLRAARRQVLAKYGIDAPDTPMPDFESMPAGIAPGAPPPGTQMPRSGGSGALIGGIGAGIGALTPGLVAALHSRQQGSAFGAPSAGSVRGSGGVGYAPMSSMGGISGGVPESALNMGLVDTSGLSNWAQWQNYGVPESGYGGD